MISMEYKRKRAERKAIKEKRNLVQRERKDRRIGKGMEEF